MRNSFSDPHFLSRDDEIKKFWNNAPNYFAKGYEACSELPGTDALHANLFGSFSDGIWHRELNVKINASRIDSTHGFDQQLSIGREEARSMYNNGYTLCFSDLSNEMPVLSAFKDSALKIFGPPELIQITAYLSAPKTTGVLHFDSQHNFFIQREGSKKWFVSSKAAVKNPYQNLVCPGATLEFFESMAARGYNILQPSECGRLEFLLEPGDVLYVPPGFYHSPETLETPSLHYTLTIEPSSFWPKINNSLYEIFMRHTSLLNVDERFLTDEEMAEHRKVCVALLFEEISKLR